jgi:hypothetical protein
MPVTPFIPAIAGAAAGIFGGKAATSAAMKRSPEEQQALTGAQGAGTSLGTQGGSLFKTGTGMVQQGQSTVAQPTNYFSKLLSGNRALQSQAVAAPRAAISDTYRGAERNLEQGGVRGASRDQAKGDLSRQRAGQISSLITGVQPAAAGALTSIGENQTSQGVATAGQGVGATGASGNIFANLLQQGNANRQYGRSEGQNFGSGFGGLIFDMLQATGKFKGKSGGGPGYGAE